MTITELIFMKFTLALHLFARNSDTEFHENMTDSNLHVCTVHQQYQSLYYPTNALNYINRNMLKPVKV
jgi:hypothetical protein